ncbi:MAG: histidinol dehydrogenase [Desulfobacteraceae bacterium]|nr:histidinol dehydrogenase [Desulfobacteraceae bacterium]
MGGIPARVAGVRSHTLRPPPMAVGTITPYILAAADRVGITDIFNAGSAWSIAALAFATATVPKVDVIVGPGMDTAIALANRLAPGHKKDMDKKRQHSVAKTWGSWFYPYTPCLQTTRTENPVKAASLRAPEGFIFTGFYDLLKKNRGVWGRTNTVQAITLLTTTDNSVHYESGSENEIAFVLSCPGKKENDSIPPGPAKGPAGINLEGFLKILSDRYKLSGFTRDKIVITKS